MDLHRDVPAVEPRELRANPHQHPVPDVRRDSHLEARARSGTQGAVDDRLDGVRRQPPRALDGARRSMARRLDPSPDERWTPLALDGGLLRMKRADGELHL